ncbi:hypothetical protein HY969_01270 [Candidatus Kaiserbacteria bacterium]|nr:hypothetical protein [Candidatus Kaiserbacteria bacterium]
MGGLDAGGLRIPDEMSDADGITIAKNVIDRLSELDRFNVGPVKASQTMAEQALINGPVALLSEVELKHQLQVFEIPADVRKLSIQEVEYMYAVATRFLDKVRQKKQPS